MPDISADKVTATTYPPETLYESWCNEADQRDIATSQYIIRMVEAGRKQVDVEELASDSIQELRQQRADLQQELEHQRSRVRELEEQLHHTAQADIVEFVEENPGAATPEIIQHIAETVPARVASHLDLLEGQALTKQDGGYHLNVDGVEAAIDSATDQKSSMKGTE
jgi:predicted RNase H-like nuclease (RuvC/YqgF family)